MSTITAEPAVETAPSEDTDSDWYAGYSLVLPCQWKEPVPCDQEADWFVKQHGCMKAELCEDHLFLAYRDTALRIAEWGSVQCRICKREFVTPDTFMTAVRI